MNAIFTRRSIRKFVEGTISDEQIHLILTAAMCAPTARNVRPWEFIVIRDKSILADLANVSQYSKMTADANFAIVVCADMQLQPEIGYCVQDCSAAVENILVEVDSLGLGAVWLGVYPRQDRIDFIRNYFNLPVNIMPIAMIPIGPPGEIKETHDRFDGAKVHYEKW